nr:N-acetylmuramoyl-L-alanine amidase [uncultured Peptostreptococcus sp.]
MRKFIYVVSLLVVVSFVLVACGPQNSGQVDKGQSNQSYRETSRDKDKKAVVRHTVVIDPGHQEAPMNELEPIGPGASQSKPMLSSGTAGVVTGVTEYQLNLDVSLKLRDELEARGYRVVMIREDNHCPISNKGRAEIANQYTDGIFLRIHANGDSNSSTSGMLTMCPASDNPYTPDIVRDSRRLSQLILAQMLSSTGAANKGLIETNNMSGINWCRIPVSIIEMGFMSNPHEDRLMQTQEYQAKIVEGIANGVDKYFEI